MTQKLQIKTESLPQRCEICHQEDRFTPESGVCLRCKDVDVADWSSSRQPLVSKVGWRIALVSYLLGLCSAFSLFMEPDHIAENLYLGFAIMCFGVGLTAFLIVSHPSPSPETKTPPQIQGIPKAQAQVFCWVCIGFGVLLLVLHLMAKTCC
ncbi:MAG: hypothetical protein HY774_08875 [Acidobacteria bacterium]|nr:hypothetical protein [Acidobacteriota bacterium]